MQWTKWQNTPLVVSLIVLLVGIMLSVANLFLMVTEFGYLEGVKRSWQLLIQNYALSGRQTDIAAHSFSSALPIETRAALESGFVAPYMTYVSGSVNDLTFVLFDVGADGAGFAIRHFTGAGLEIPTDGWERSRVDVIAGEQWIAPCLPPGAAAAEDVEECPQAFAEQFPDRMRPAAQ
jgi:hypothetical protein